MEQPASAATVGFVGVGSMGLPMARNVLRRGPVVVYDPNPAPVADLVAEGASDAESPAAVARASDVVVVMVATGAQLDSALFGDQGVASGLRPGQVVIVMSTVGVDAVRDLDRRLADAGVLLVDAPVTGGVARATSGELILLVGGTPEALGAVEPVLAAMGKIARCGDRVGDGQAVKMVNQLLCSVHLAAAGEALGLAESLGLDPQTVLDAIGGGAASSFMLLDRGARMLADTEPPTRSAIDIFVKDCGLVLAAAEGADASVPLAATAAQVYLDAKERGWGRRDDSRVIDLYRDRAATENR